MSSVTKLRDGQPSLQDIPAQLEHLAKCIRDGDYGDVATAYVIIPREDDWPHAFGYGDVNGDNQPIVALEVAKAWFVNNKVTRI